MTELHLVAISINRALFAAQSTTAPAVDDHKVIGPYVTSGKCSHHGRHNDRDGISRVEAVNMLSVHQLWELLHIAQEEENSDAALCFRHAIEAYNRCDRESVEFWYRQAQMCESAAAQSNA
jgi:hypothetical protein